MILAEKIRTFARRKYVLAARSRRMKRFSIRAGDVEHELGVSGRLPAICSALRTRRFLTQNNLRLVETSGPPSGQSSTVVLTYEFKDSGGPSADQNDAWKQLRGALKDVFAELGGGESYLSSERTAFRGTEQNS